MIIADTSLVAGQVTFMLCLVAGQVTFMLCLSHIFQYVTLLSYILCMLACLLCLSTAILPILLILFSVNLTYRDTWDFKFQILCLFSIV
jgi:hypothetical protein